MDLSQLYKNSSNTASLMMGEQFYAGQQQKAADLQSTLLANQNSAVMNPLNAQHKQGQIAQQQAELPGIMGQSQSHVAQGKLDEQTVVSKVAAVNSKALTQLDEDGLKRFEQDTERTARAVQILKTIPNVAGHKAAFQAIMQRTGGSVDSPYMQQLLKLPDEAFTKTLEMMSKGQQMAGAKFQQERQLKSDENASQEKISSGNNKTQLEIAKIQAEARKQVAAERSTAVQMMTTDKAIAYLEMIPPSERTLEQNEQLENLKRHDYTKRAVGANAVTPELLNQQTPVQRAAQAARPQGQPAGNPNIRSAVEASGAAYEPNKYDYRIGPNGEVQRKLK